MEIEMNAFLICGGDVNKMKYGYQWEAEKLVDDIRLLSQMLPCPKCGEIPKEGWIIHAMQNHCNGLVTESTQIPIFWRIKEGKCLICDLIFQSETENISHTAFHFEIYKELSLHYNHFWKSTDDILQASRGFQADKRTVLLKTYLHFKMNRYQLNLWLFVPSWLNGNTLKEQMLSVEEPTYFPVAIGRYTNDQLFQMLPNAKHFNIYQTVLHDPSMDETFNGFERIQEAFFLEKIRLLAMLRQRPAAHSNYHFIGLTKNLLKHHVKNYFGLLKPTDLRKVIKDVIVNHRTVVCFKDFSNTETGCTDPLCQCYIHFGVNVKLLRAAEEKINYNLSVNRHSHYRYQIGRFEIEDNPPPERWEDYVQELLEERDYHINHPRYHFIYVVLAIKPEIIQNAKPTLACSENYIKEGKYNVYVGSSAKKGVGDHHFLRDPEEYDDECEDELKIHSTTLAKIWVKGENQLFLLRNTYEDSIVKAKAQEAAVQIYSAIARHEDFSGKVKVINDVIEGLAFSSLSYHEVHTLMSLAEKKIELFYDNMDDYNAMLTEKNLEPLDWGILKEPIYLSSAVKLPL